MSKYHCHSCGIAVNDSNGMCYAFPGGDEILCNACDAQDIVTVNAPADISLTDKQSLQLALQDLFAAAGVKIEPGQTVTLTNEQIAKLLG